MKKLRSRLQARDDPDRSIGKIMDGNLLRLRAEVESAAAAAQPRHAITIPRGATACT